LYDADLAYANVRWGILERATLQSADLEAANLWNANIKGASLWGANVKGANLRLANLEGAYLSEANLKGADLTHANVKGANLWLAKLEGANLYSANLTNADLPEAKLNGAILQAANLEGAEFQGAFLIGVRLAGANLSNAIYAPASRPPDGYLEGIEGLATVTFPPGQQSGLVQLRDLLQRTGLRDLEREATFAIERGKAYHARQSLSTSAQLGGWLQFILFEKTVGWGLYPSRALIYLLGLMLFLGVFVYPCWIVAGLGLGSRQNGIFKVYPHEEYDLTIEKVDRDEFVILPLKAEWLAAFGYGLWFSLLSAFHIGWRDLNAGAWLSRIQPNAYALRARGWVRVVSGLQSLASVYLIAMWVLTYLGRPFG
jgi:hypothetical protein